MGILIGVEGVGIINLSKKRQLKIVFMPLTCPILISQLTKDLNCIILMDFHGCLVLSCIGYSVGKGHRVWFLEELIVLYRDVSPR